MTTAKVSGYQFITSPIQHHGFLKVAFFLLGLFLVVRIMTLLFLTTAQTLVSFIVFIHILCFYAGPRKTEKEATKWLKEHFIESVYPKMLKYYSEEGNRLYIAVREDTDEVIGMTSYEKKVHFNIPNLDPKDGVQLTRVSVNDGYKSRGIASKLSKLIEEEAKMNGKKYISLITLRTNKAAIGLYKKNGYQLIQQEDPDLPPIQNFLGITRVFMYKTLS